MGSGTAWFSTLVRRMASSARVSRLSFHFMWVCFKQILVIVVVSLAVQVIACLKVQSTTQIMLPIDEDDG